MRLSTALITDSLLIAGDVEENVKRSPSIKLSPPSASVNFAVSPVVASSASPVIGIVISSVKVFPPSNEYLKLPSLHSPASITSTTMS